MINRFLLESKENYREYTDEELRMIQTQDMERLRKMELTVQRPDVFVTVFCAISEKAADERCGNCSNCLEEFEELDASQAAADVIRCIRTSGQRFGINMIAGTLLGENTAKIRNYRMDRNRLTDPRADWARL